MNGDQILETGRKTFRSEAETLNSVADQLDHTFTQAVKKLLLANGRVVLTGIGKNQFIGKKIAATFNSIGKSALFLHAADAVHGDLGLLNHDDVVIVLSKSGNTSEIKVLIPLLRQLSVFIIGWSTDPASFLALQSDIHLTIPVQRESCPLNLTPTNSTTAFLAMGDAMAMCLMESERFSKDDFARFHPGGAIGKKLYLKVHDLYPLNEKPLVHPETSLRETILEISKKRLGATAVADEQGIRGIITDGDLRRLFEQGGDLSARKAADAMTRGPKTIHPGAFAFEALERMRANNITQLIVCDKSTYLGMVHLHDILKEGII